MLCHRGQEGCGIVSYDGKNFHSEKRQGLVGDHFTKPEILNKLPGLLQLGITDIRLQERLHLEIYSLFCRFTYTGGLSIAHNGNLTNACFKRGFSERRSYIQNNY